MEKKTIKPEWLEELTQAGFVVESQGVSSEMIKVNHDGFQYTAKVTPNNDIKLSDDIYEVGVYINPEFGGMQVFACNCTLGCCPEEVHQGIAPYTGVENLLKMIQDFIALDQEFKIGFKRH